MKNIFTKILLIVVVCLTGLNAKSFTIMELIFSKALNGGCQGKVIFINDSMFNDINNVTASVEIYSTDFQQEFDPVFDVYGVSLTNTSYFEYIGYLDFDPNNINVGRRHAFRFIYDNFQFSNIAYFEFSLYVNSEAFYNSFSVERACSPCNYCFSRLPLYTLFLNMPQLLIGSIEYPGNGFDVPFGEMSYYNQQVITQAINWVTGNPNPHISDYLDILDVDKLGESSVPNVFCNGKNGIEVSCSAQKSFLNQIKEINLILEANHPNDSSSVALFYTIQQITFIPQFTSCMPWGDYLIWFNYHSVETGYHISFIPMQSGLPSIISSIVFDNNVSYSKIAFSYNHLAGDFTTLPEGIIYNGNGEFAYQYGFTPINSDTTFHPFAKTKLNHDETVYLCSGSSYLLGFTSTNYVSQVWSNSQSAQTIQIFETGDYFVTVTHEEGCYSNSDTLSVVQVPLNDPMCESTYITAPENSYVNPSKYSRYRAIPSQRKHFSKEKY